MSKDKGFMGMFKGLLGINSKSTSKVNISAEIINQNTKIDGGISVSNINNSIVNIGGTIIGDQKLGFTSINGMNDFESQIRSVGKFTGLMVGDGFEVDIESSDECLVEITGNKNILEYIDIANECETLRLGLKNGNTYNNINLKAKVKMPKLEYIKGIDGAVIRTNKDVKFGDDTKIDLNGVSRYFGNVDSDKLVVNLSGCSEAYIDGKSDEMKSRVLGASLLHGSHVTNQADISVSGASNAKIHVKQEIVATASDVSTISFDGNPSSRTITEESVSKIIGLENM